MNSGAHGLLLGLMLVLPLSALLARRVPLNHVMKLVVIWIVLFAAATLIVMAITG